MKRERQTNIEALRVISMLMIITMHFLGHGGVMRSFSSVSSMQLACEFLSGISRVAVNCFILISGYFMVDSRFKWSKVLRIGIEIWFYSITIYMILLVSGNAELGFKNLMYVLFPISTNSDAFSTEYLVMYTLSPFLNLMINHMDKKQYNTCMVLLVSIFIILPGMLCFMGETMPYGGPYGIGWFLILYMTGAYIKRHGINSSKARSIALYLFSGMLVPASSICASLLFKVTQREVFWNFKELLYSYNSILVYPASVALFVMMLKIKVSNLIVNRVIMFCAPATFGIYLIHDNRFFRKVLWGVINPAQYANTPFLFVYWLCVILGIFMLCVVIDKVRERAFAFLYQSRMYKQIENKINDIDA